MRKMQTALGCLIAAIGCVHIALTGQTYGEWLSGRSLYFIGAGLAIILLGFMTVIAARTSDRIVLIVALASNSAGVALFALGAFILPMPQVFLLLALLAGAFVVGLVNARRPFNP